MGVSIIRRKNDHIGRMQQDARRRLFKKAKAHADEVKYCRLSKVSKGDALFLKKLDKKLRNVERKPYEFTPNMSGRPFTVVCEVDNYDYGQKITAHELERLLKIVKCRDLVFTPINTCMGFAVGFEVIRMSTRKSLLRFVERQLPEGQNFNTISSHFLGAENKERAKKLGLLIVNSRSHYDY